MAVTMYTFSTPEEFTTWTENNLVPQYLGAVELTGSTDKRWTGYADAEKTQKVLVYNFSSPPSFVAYKSPSVYGSIDGVTGTLKPVPNIFVCGGGVMIEVLSRNICALLAKTNNNVTACIIGGSSLSGSSGRSSLSGVYSFAYGDDTTISSKRTFNPVMSTQTCLVPFRTDANAGSTSYTPKAFYMPEAQYYSSGMGTFTAGGKTYLTNGYWAIVDDSD